MIIFFSYHQQLVLYCDTECSLSKNIDVWLQMKSYQSNQDLLFPITYNGLRIMLRRISNTIGGKRVAPHILSRKVFMKLIAFLPGKQI